VKRRLWDRLLDGHTLLTLAVILAGSGALAAVLTAADWARSSLILILCGASVVAHAIFLPGPLDGEQTLGPAVAGAGLTLLGAPAAALALAGGCLLGQGLLRRRPPTRTLFAAAQSVLATLAASGVAYLVYFDLPSLASPLFLGRLAADYLLGTLLAGVAFVAVWAALGSLRIGAVRPAAPVGGVAGAMAAGIVCATALFAVGAVGALVVVRAAPPATLALAVPAVLVGALALLLVAQRQASADAEVLQAALAGLGQSPSLRDAAHTAAEMLGRLVPTEIVVIFLGGPGQAASPLFYRGPGGPEFGRSLEPDGIAAHAMRTGQAVRVGEYGRDPRHSPHMAVLFGRRAVRSVVAAPVAAGRDVWGAIVLARPLRHAFGARHERLVRVVADALGMAVRMLALMEQAREQAERLATIQHAGLLAWATLDPDGASHSLAVRAAEIMGARYAFVALLDPEGRELSGKAAYGTDPAAYARFQARVAPDAADLAEAVRAVRERRTIVCDEAAVAGSACPSLHGLADARGALVTPIRRGGTVMGALTVVFVEPRHFTETEVATIEAIAGQGAVVMDAARRHAAMEEQVRQFEAVARVSRRLREASDLRAVFGVVAQGVRDVLGGDRCLLVAWDGASGAPQVLADRLSDEFVETVREQLPAGVGRTVLHAGQPIDGDFMTDGRLAPLRDAARREGLRSVAFFPMRAQGAVIGALAVFDGDLRGAAAAAPAEVFVDQIAAAVRHAVTLGEREERLNEMSLRSRLVAAVSTSLDLGEMLKAVASELTSAAGIPRVTAYRLEGQVLRLVAQAGASDAPVETPATLGVTGRVVRTGRAEFVPNVREDPEYVRGNYDVTSLAVVPILQEGAVTGLLVAEGVAAKPVTPAAFALLTAFAGHLNIAVRNAAVYEEQRRAHDELQVLYEAARAVSGTLDLRTVLDSLVTVTCRTFGYDSGAVLMVGGEGGELTVEAAYGERTVPVGTVLPAGVGVTGWVVRSGTPLVVDDVRADPRYHRLDERTRSELAVPLIAEGKVLGVFNIESARLGAFGARDLRLLATLASYAVVAIQNARLYEQAQRLAITDGLTELYNHRYLHESLGRVLERARRDGQPVGLIMLEIDQFKRYNDTYGHQSGDVALRVVAGLLRRGSRPSDIVARYGGDEFMVILPGADKAAAQETGERLRRAVEAYPLILGDDVITSVTLSVGVAAYPHDGITVDQLVEAVDAAQYTAKRSGGNKVYVAHAP
jgi:diguanylate cyclase (GGDEF)-like protein